MDKQTQADASDQRDESHANLDLIMKDRWVQRK